MNQKTKTIIGLISFLCGSLIILFTLRDNQKNNRQKNNFSIAVQNIEENNENFQETSSSFLFWTVFIVAIVIILAIILFTIYRQKKKKKNFIPVNADEWKTEVEQINNYYLYNPDQEDLLQDQNKDKDDLLNQKKSFKCGILTFAFGIHIVFQQNPEQTNNESINNILNTDLYNKQSLLLDKITNTDFYLKAPNDYLKDILQMMVNFLTTYLTSQLLEDVHADNNDCKILKYMADKFKESSDPVIILYTRSTTISEFQNNIDQEVSTEDLNQINQGKYQDLLKTIMRREKATFIKNNNEKHYLFLKSFNFYKFIDLLYQDLVTFMKNKNEYNEILTQMQTDKEKIDNYFDNK